MYSLWKVWELSMRSIYLSIFYRFSLAMSLRSCSEGSSLACFMRVLRKERSSSSIFYCSCFIYIWSWTLRTFRLLLCCELYYRLLESCPPFDSAAILFTLADEFWARPVTVAWAPELPVFFERVFLSPSLSLTTYSETPGTS